MIITFGAANLGNIVDIENNKKFERDEGLMFPGFYNGLNELNNDNNGLSSGMCLASMKNNEKVFCPLINLSYGKMVKMALPYTIVLGSLGYIMVKFVLG